MINRKKLREDCRRFGFVLIFERLPFHLRCSCCGRRASWKSSDGLTRWCGWCSRFVVDPKVTMYRMER